MRKGEAGEAAEGKTEAMKEKREVMWEFGLSAQRKNEAWRIISASPWFRPPEQKGFTEPYPASSYWVLELLFRFGNAKMRAALFGNSVAETGFPIQRSDIILSSHLTVEWYMYGIHAPTVEISESQ